MTTPLIPARCINRPQVAGLVVPYISIESGDGRAVLGAVHTSRMRRCVTHNLCQVCAQRLSRPVVVFVRQRDLDNQWTSEPALHPECARYSAQACPMLAGRMTHYRSTPHDVSRLKCNEPGCDCDGWVNADDGQHRAGAPAEPYFALWLPRTGVAVNPAGEVIGVTWAGIDPLRIRPVVRASSHEPAPQPNTTSDGDRDA